MHTSLFYIPPYLPPFHDAVQATAISEVSFGLWYIYVEE